MAFWRAALASALICPFAARGALRELAAATPRERIAGLAAGLFLALHFATWVTSLSLTSVAASTVIVCSTPLWVALLAPVITHDRVGRSAHLGIALSVVGAAVIGWGDLGLSREALMGDALALVGALMAALYVLAGRRLRPRVSLPTYTLAVYGTAAVFLLAFALAGGTALRGYPSETWGWLVALALVPQLVGHTSYNYALRWVDAALVSVSMLGEPIGATLLAWWLLAEVPVLATLFGGVLILAGIARVATSKA